MNKWVLVLGGTWLLGGACVVREEAGSFGNTCEERRRECQVGYSEFAGYFRTCNTTARPCLDQSVAANEGQEDDENETGSDASESGSGGSAAAPPESDSEDDNVGVATPPDPERYSAFDIACERDSQCGPGKCIEGECFYGCHSDAQCGSGDRCAVESGTRICRPDPNPDIECTRAAQCSDGSTCLNGACRQTCSSTEQCDNVLDRCTRGVCEPDRRPLGECVLNVECAEGFVCLDGACIPACASGADGGACLQEGRGDEGSAAPGSGDSPAPPPVTPPVDSDDGSDEPDDGDAPGTGDDDGVATADAGAAAPLIE